MILDRLFSHATAQFRPETTAMQARLKVLHDKANVKQVKLLPVTLIGRSTDCNLKIASSQVSRNHCRITLADDTVFVEDLGSANGTLIDGQLLPAHQPTAIPPGAHLIVGPAEFLIDYVAPTSATMVLSRSGQPAAADLPSTEVIFPEPAAISVREPVPAPVLVSSVVSPPVVSVPLAAPVIAAVAVDVIAATASPVLPESRAAEDAFQSAESPSLESAETVSDFDFAAAANPPESNEATMFSFAESPPGTSETASAPTNSAESSSKKGGLKSLFSLFGKKERQAVASSPEITRSSPTTAPSVFLPTMDVQVVEVAAIPSVLADSRSGQPDEQVDATTETTELGGPKAPETSSEEDDGFQQFLQQL